MILNKQNVLTGPVRLGGLDHGAPDQTPNTRNSFLHLIILLTTVRENFKALEDVEARDSLSWTRSRLKENANILSDGKILWIISDRLFRISSVFISHISAELKVQFSFCTFVYTHINLCDEPETRITHSTKKCNPGLTLKRKPNKQKQAVIN